MRKQSAVAVLPIEESVQKTVRRAMELASWEDYLEAGRPTALKINLGWDLFIPGSITSPWVLEGVIQTIQSRVGPLFLVESDQVVEDIEKAFRKAKMNELCDRYNLKWVNMSRTEQINVEVPEGRVFSRLEVARILTDCQVITIPVMKTHAKTDLTGAIKNQWGCISKLRHNYHLVLSDALADINLTLRPRFAVMDATIALEGNGPKSGVPKVVDRILASSDLVAMDTVQARIMGLDPLRIGHISACAERCLGTNRWEEIEIRGETGVESLNLTFRPARHNLVSRLEELLRRSRWKWIFFDTPLFYIMLGGAKTWYWIWYHFVNGKKHWRTVLKHPFYGPQWEHVRSKRAS